MKNHNKNWIDYIVLSIFVSIFMLLFATTTSPLFDNLYGWDSAYFRFIGESILKGKTPYIDIWDNKGPVFYFIQAIGAINGTQNKKISFIFLMEVASLTGSICLMYNADKIINPNKKLRVLRYLGLIICSLPVFISKNEHTNLTEEWSIPMICISLYLFTKYSFQVISTSNVSNKENPNKEHPKWYAFCHGICLSLIAFIRINNSITICAGLLVIGTYLLIKKLWKNLFENIIFGFLGILTVTLPVFLWYAQRHALKEMLYSIFTYNLKYMNTNAHHFLTWSDFHCYLPLIICFILIFMNFIRTHKFLIIDYFAAAITAANTVLLINQNNYYYFIIVFPVVLFIYILYAKIPRIPEIIITLVCYMILFPISREVFLRNFWENNQPFFPAAKQYLPKSERNSMIAIDIPPSIYLLKGMYPCSRFAAYQSLHFKVEPKFKEEFIDDLETNKPKWIVTYCDVIIPHPDIQEIIDTKYTVDFNDTIYCFYQRK